MIACLAEHGVDLSSAGLVVGTSVGGLGGRELAWAVSYPPDPF